MIDHRGRKNRHHHGLIGPLRIAAGRMLIAAPVVLFAVGCGALQAVGDFPNPKDTVTVYATPPPQPAATGVAATSP
jgi:hypothetical protein